MLIRIVFDWISDFVANSFEVAVHWSNETIEDTMVPIAYQWLAAKKEQKLCVNCICSTYSV